MTALYWNPGAPRTAARHPGQPCQVADGDEPFACPYYESGGYRCENPIPDHGDHHWWSEHTIQHSIAGNGYACESFG